MSNPLGLKNQYKRLAKGLDQLLEQQHFTRWFHERITSSDLKSDKKKKLQFINGVLSNLRMIKKNIGKAGVGAGLASSQKTIDVYNDIIDRLIEIVVKNKPDDVPAVTGFASLGKPPSLPYDLMELASKRNAQQQTEIPQKERSQPEIPLAPVVASTVNNYTHYVPKAIMSAGPGVSKHYLYLLNNHRIELLDGNGNLTTKLQNIHKELREMEQAHKVPDAQRQIRTTGKSFGRAGTPKWRRLDPEGEGGMKKYKEGRTRSGGKRKTRKHKRRRKRKTKKHRKKKRTRRRKPKKRHRRTRRR